jgi:hypothetical protein
VGGAYFFVASIKSAKIQINQSGSAHCTVLAETFGISSSYLKLSFSFFSLQMASIGIVTIKNLVTAITQVQRLF